VAQSVAA